MLRLFLALLMAVTPVPGQTNQLASAASSATIATSLTGVKQGNLVGAFVFCINTSTVTNVKDDLGNSAIRTISFNWSADGAFMEHWLFPNCAGGNRTYTATFSPAATFRTIHVAELQGADPSAKTFDTTSSTSGTSTTPTATSVTPKWDSSLVFASAASVTTAAPAAAAPYTSLATEATNFTTTEYLSQSTAAGTAAGWTQSTSRGWGAIATVILPDKSSGRAIPTRGDPGCGPFDRYGFLKQIEIGVPVAAVAANVTVLTDIGSLTLAGFAPVLDTAFNTGVGSLTLNGFVPTLGLALNTGVGSLTLTGFASVIDSKLNTGVGALALSALAPVLDSKLNTGLGALLLSGLAPSLDSKINVDVGALTLGGFVPSVLVGTNIQTDFGTLTLVGLAPVLDTSIATDVGSLTFSGLSPEIQGVVPPIVENPRTSPGGGSGRKRVRRVIEAPDLSNVRNLSDLYKALNYPQAPKVVALPVTKTEDDSEMQEIIAVYFALLDAEDLN